MKVFAKVSWCVIFMGLAGIVVAADSKAPSPVQKELYNLLLKKHFAGNLSIDGRVEDSSGTLLSNVVVKAESMNLVAGNNSSNTTEVSGRFRFSWSNCTMVRITFEKAGYESVRYDLAFKETKDRNLTSVGSYAETNVVIALGRSGELVYFPEYHDFLSYDERGKWGVLLFVNGDGSFTSLTRSPAMARRAATNYWYLTCDTNEIGKIKVGANGIPQNLQIVMTDTTGGFLDLCSTPKLRGNDQLKKFDTMKDAPDVGYTNALCFNQPKQQHFFYFRVKYKDDKLCYGKGYACQPGMSVWGSNTVVDTAIKIYIQPNGSRNVRCKMD